MRAAERVGRRHVLSSDCIGQSVMHRRRSNRTNLNSAAGIVAAGLLAFAYSQAKANVPLFTTQEDFVLDPGSQYQNQGWTAGGSATIAPSNAWDSDGSVTNGLGNLTNQGGTGTAGSLQISLPASNIGYTDLANAPGVAFYNQNLMNVLDPGSIAAYTAAAGGGNGTLTAYSGTIQYTITAPIGATGGYFQPGLEMNDNAGGYRTSFDNNPVYDGLVNGLPTYTANIPYTITAGSYGYFQFEIFLNSGYSANGPLYVDNIQVVTNSSVPPGNAEWITNGNGAWTNDANWNTSAPTVAGTSATFDTDGGTITVNPMVTLSSPVTIDSLTFNASSISYTIANGGTGSIKTNSINVLAGSHTVNAGIVVTNGAVFNISAGSSLTATNVIDGVGYYHNVEVTGGGSLTVNALNNAALDVNNATLTTTAGNTGEFVYLEHGAVWNIDATSTIEQYYDDQTPTLNLAAGVTLYTEQNIVQIGGTLTGAGNISFGGGANGFNSGQYGALNGNNSNYSGAVTITGGGTLSITTDNNLGNGSATNTLNISNGTLNLSGGVVGTQGLIVGSAGGTITTNGFNMQVGNLTGTGALILSGGNTLTVAPQAAPANGSGGVRVLTSGGLNLSTTNLTLATASSQSIRSVLVAGGLTLSGTTNAWTSLVDLGGNDLVVKNGSLATILNQANQGLATGTGGIESSLAQADSTHLTALGIIQNSQNQSPGGTVLYSSFEGTSGDTSADVLVKYTYVGDANLDGKVDGSDYTRIDNGFLTHLTGWYNGDFNYDGVVNGSDYTLIDNDFNRQGAHLTAEVAAQLGGGSAVPEPASLGLLIMGATSLLGRRRGRRHE